MDYFNYSGGSLAFRPREFIYFGRLDPFADYSGGYFGARALDSR